MNKTTLFGKLQVLFLLFVFISGSVLAGNIDVNNSNATKLKLKENTYSTIRVNNTVAGVDFVNVKTKEGDFTLFTIEDYGFTTLLGDPKLPVVKKLIEVPLNAAFDYEIIVQDFQDFNLTDYNIENFVIPVQPSLSKSDDPESVEFVYNRDAYEVDDFLGQQLVKVVDLGIMRGVRLARLEISPIFYNPVQNVIRVYYNLEVRVNFTGGNVQSTIQSKQELFSPYFEGAYANLINYKSIESKELILDEPPTFIIVSDPMFETILQPYIEWKIKKGFNVVEAYTNNPSVGTTTSSIQSYLEDYYNNPPANANPQSFVLFVGDQPQIPAFNGTAGSHVSDLYYCEYTGDIFPECYYGRFSANNVAELQPQIDKTLEYEQYLFPDPTFLDEVVMVAGADGGYQTHSNGQINYGTDHYFNLEHGITSHTYLQPEPGGGNYSQNIRQNISDGVAFGNYTAHCSASGWADPNFTNNHVPALTNASKYPLLIGNCCQSNDFTVTCFGETLLRAVDKGAIGYIGGTNSTYWDEDFWFGVGAETVTLNPPYNAENIGVYDGLFHDHGEPLDDWYVTNGQVITAGNLAVSQAGSSMETYYWEIYHLMGDPSMSIYLTQPPDPTANYQALMPLASASFPVNTDPYAFVAISKGGVLHGCAVADETGYAEVNMFDPIEIPGEADVVITRQNLKPYMGTVTVASPTTAYVLLDEFGIDDSNGNGSGMVDFGENILLDVTLENVGSVDATNLTATISTDDEYITIDVAANTWPDIVAGSNAELMGAFEFTVDEMIEDQHVASFEMDVTDGTDTWNSMFNITLNAPVLTVGSYSIDDAAGNNNGRLDPGETVNILIPNTNEGGCEALSTIATAVSSNPLLTVNTATYELGTIGTNETAQAQINVTVSAAAPIGEVVTMNYAVESSPYSATSNITMNVGLIVEDFESGGFESYAWEFGGSADWTIDNASPYEGIYSAKSGSISDDQTTSLMVTADVANDDEISFYYKVSSESGYDYLRFYIDNVMQNEWAGDVEWTMATYDVSAGEHTFKWAYEKDYSVSSGSDCAWVDYIVFPAFGGVSPLGVAVSAVPAEICASESSQLNAFAMGGSGSYTYEWMPTDGLSDPTVANPIATPASTTTYYVVVDDGDGTVTDNLTVTVNPVPVMPTITQQGNLLSSSSTSGNQWYNSNGMIAGATGQTYEPLATDDYYVIVTNEFGCESEASDIYHFVYTGIIDISEGQNVALYPNPFKDQFTLDYTIKSASKVSISVFNTYGQQILQVSEESMQSVGDHRVTVDAGNMESGIYYCKIETADFTVVKQIVHTK